MINIYSLHSNSKSLFGYKEAMTKVPHMVWEKYQNSSRQLRKYESLWAQDPKYAYYYVIDVLGKRWPLAEPMIAKDPKWAYRYARDVLGKRWPLAEPMIAKDPESAYFYARDILGKRWPLAEPVIAKDKEAWKNYKIEFRIK